METHHPSTPKQKLQAAFAALAQGDGRPLVDLMADDFAWVLPGTTAWSRRYAGKQVVRDELFRPLFAQFAGTYRNVASRFVAEGDIVVVQCRGDVVTRAGKPYRNDYCYVCRFGADGLMYELHEYLDTQLVATVLTPP